jgi:predicted lipid-binding transport protein (Tim44 family)
MPGIEEKDMNFSQRTRGIVRAFAVVLSLAIPLAMAISSADARVGGGSSSGSRGSRTYSAPPSTTTAPNAAQPMNRTFSQPGAPAAAGAAAGAAKGGFFSRPGMGMMMGGLAAGFLGAGLFGMLSGGGLMGSAPPPQTGFGSGMGFGLGSSAPAPLEIQPADYEAFERLLGEVQGAWSNEDVAKLHTLATPEMVSYFTKDLEQNKANNDINKVSDVKLLQGDLAEAWREGETDYASVALRFSLVDKTLERGTSRLVGGSETPTEATEVWTFARQRGGNWELSAIQQTN